MENNIKNIVGNGVQFIILDDDPYLDIDLKTIEKKDNKFPIGSILLKPKTKHNDADYEMYFVDASKIIHKIS